MSALSITPPFPTFAGKDGLPLEDGYIWLGSANLNPQTSPLVAYWDETLTQIAQQPIRTLGGYPAYSGTPARLFISAAVYSILVQDKNGNTVYTSPSNTGPSTFVNFSVNEEVQVATAGQTVFTLANTYSPGTNSLTVYVDGVNQYDGAQYSFVETSGDTVTFTSGLHVGALVKFSTAIQLSGGVADSSQITYVPAGTGAVTTNVQTKLRESVSVKDFGAVGDGVTDDTVAIQAAIDYIESINYGALFFPLGTYKLTDTLRVKKTQSWCGIGGTINSADSDYTTDSGTPNVVTGGVIIWQSQADKNGLLIQQDPVDTYKVVMGMEHITWVGQITNGGVGPSGTTGSGIVVDPQSINFNVECHFYNVNISYFREYGLRLLDGYYGSTFDVMSINGCGKSGIAAVANLGSQGEYSFSNIRAFSNGYLGSGETEQAGIYINSGGSGVTLKRISCTLNTLVGLLIDGTQHQLIDYQSEGFPANNANCRSLIFENCQPSVLRANFSPNSGFLGVCVELRTATNGNLIGLNFYSAVDASGYQVYEDATSGTNVIVGSSATGTVYKQIQPYTLFGFGADAYGYGTQTNNNATAGNVGEFVTATVAAGVAVALTTATPKTVTSISLTAGDWDVSAVGDFTLTGATTSYFRTSVSNVDNTMSAQTGGSGIGTDPLVRIPLILTTVTSDFGQTLPPVRISLAATTTIYLVCETTFSAGSVSAFGTIRARRMR